MKTRITEMFGIEYPIICGAMYLIGNPGLAAAISNAGGMGNLTAGTTRRRRAEEGHPRDQEADRQALHGGNHHPALLSHHHGRPPQEPHGLRRGEGGRIYDVVSCADLLGRMVRDAEQNVKRLGGLF